MQHGAWPGEDLHIGLIDRSARIGVGLLLIVLAFVGTIGAWGYVGLIPLITGMASVCPIYALFGIRTCGRDTP